MIATLIGKNSIHKITLPKNAIGNYCISDFDGEIENKLLNIEGKNGEWIINSSENVKILNPQYIDNSMAELRLKTNNIKPVEYAILKEYNMYYLTIGVNNDIYILYISPSYDKTLEKYGINGENEIYIGNTLTNQIAYNCPLVSNKHAKIYKEDSKWYIQNNDKKIGTFVNGEALGELPKKLEYGDVIFILGLKIIILPNVFYINNPLNLVKKDPRVFVPVQNNISIQNDTDEEPEKIKEYSDSDYFSRAPRINNIIEKERVRIDPPPALPAKDDMPLFLTLGSTLSMGLVMVLNMGSSITGIASGTAKFEDRIFSIIISIVMIFGMICVPILMRKYQERRKKKYEKERYEKYVKYINSRITKINEIIEKQKTTLYNNYLTAEECENLILTRSHRLWEREIEDRDFLEIRLGKGNKNLEIDLQYPEERFSMDDDNLIDILNKVGKEAQNLEDVPITLSLAEKNISALIGKNEEQLNEYAKNVIMQLVALHSYGDLKLVFLTKDEKKWEYVKMLPHTWSNSKQVRFFATDIDNMREISKYLEEIYQNRQEYSRQRADYKSFNPYYLIITDDYKSINNLKIITDILKNKENIGFGLFCIDTNMMELPNECKTFINLNEQNGIVFDKQLSITSTKDGNREFVYDELKELNFTEVSKNIANIPIRTNTASSESLPTNYSFLEMYNVGRVEQLNVLHRWNRNDSTLSLKAPIGIDSTGLPIVLDVHEKYHGPHGLIAGSTGSGKSEFIITYILSLAINYHPDDLTFLLIDYKGGGLAGAFTKNNIRLPHLVGTITNIDTNGLQRSLDSIQSELRRRQVIFNKARETTNESTIDIYKYQKLYHEGKVSEPIPHLLIICDEFAELKQQQPDFMDELISVSRIGRSLGVHLILATQKPAGIVNEQIRSNSKFGICLKVQAREDSNDIIKRPDAANLVNPGQFYIQVGNNEYFALGQSGWSGQSYIPSDTIKKKIDTAVDFITDLGVVIKKADIEKKREEAELGDQLTNIVKYICETAQDQNIHEKQLWLDSIPENIYLNEIKEKYSVQDEENKINVVIGEYDDPFNQRQGIVSLNLSGDGNSIIYGNAESGKETLVGTMVYDIMKSHTPDEAQIYILDFGTESLKIFKDSPSVGDVIFANDKEKINRLFEMLQHEMQTRKKILSEYNGDYELYLEENKKPMPILIVIINNYEAFMENYERDYEDVLQVLAREGTKSGIKFILTASAYNSVRYRMAQNFKQSIALQLNNEDDYLNIFEGVRKKRPSHIFGRGLVDLVDGNVYEFQTAKICKAGNWNMFVRNEIKALKEIRTSEAKPIPVVPDIVTIDDIRKNIKTIKKVPLGIGKKSLNVLSADFTKKYFNIISAKNIEDVAEYVSNLMMVLNELENVKLNIIDAERVLINVKVNIAETFSNIYKNALKDSKENNVITIIIGMDKFINEVDEKTRNEVFESLKATDKCNFIIVDNTTRLKSHEYDSWYKKYVSNEDGIWVGNGVAEQYSIKLSVSQREVENKCGNSFGYFIKNGNPVLMKLVGMKEKGDLYE